MIRFINKIKTIISNLIVKVYLGIWNYCRGDETFRLNYQLNSDSLVFDVGGYLGDWSDAIYQKYQCKIWIFEPVKLYYQKMSKKFSNISKIRVFNFGLGSKDEKNIFI